MSEETNAQKAERIGRWLGKMVHLGCKEHELSRVHSEAHVEVLPEHRGSADKVKTVTSTRIRRDRKARITLR